MGFRSKIDLEEAFLGSEKQQKEVWGSRTAVPLEARAMPTSLVGVWP